MVPEARVLEGQRSVVQNFQRVVTDARIAHLAGGDAFRTALVLDAVAITMPEADVYTGVPRLWWRRMWLITAVPRGEAVRDVDDDVFRQQVDLSDVVFCGRPTLDRLWRLLFSGVYERTPYRVAQAYQVGASPYQAGRLW